MKIYLLTITDKHGSHPSAYTTFEEADRACAEELRPLLREWDYDEDEISKMLTEGYYVEGDLPYGEITPIDIDPSSRTLVRILWELDLEEGEDYAAELQARNLPDLMYLSQAELNDDSLADTLSDSFGFLINGFETV